MLKRPSSQQGLNIWGPVFLGNTTVEGTEAPDVWRAGMLNPGVEEQIYTRSDPAPQDLECLLGICLWLTENLAIC